MLDPTRLSNLHPAAAPSPGAATPGRAQPSFSLRPYDHADHDRTAGSIPRWEDRAPTPEAQLTAALTGTAPAPPGHTLAYAHSTHPARQQDESFGFFDLLDMLNPLQHIPLVSHLYRSLTGDEIKPISKIIGGTLFGGPAGGAGALANVIIEHETGADVTGNVIALVRDGRAPQFRTRPDIPEQRLDEALYAQTPYAPTPNPHDPQAERTAYATLPATLQAFTAPPHTQPPAKPTPRYYAALEDDRTAGNYLR